MSTRKTPRAKKSTPSPSSKAGGAKAPGKSARGKSSGPKSARGASAAKAPAAKKSSPRGQASKKAPARSSAERAAPKKAPRATRSGAPAEVMAPDAAPQALESMTSAAPARRPGKAPTRAEADQTRKFAIEVARLAFDDKCSDVVLLDVRTMTSVSDYIVIGSGTSERQMRSVLDHVEELGASMGVTSFRRSVDERSTWILLDFVDVVVHLFEPNTRAHYDLEMMWGDAPRLEWERPDQISRDRAGLGMSAGA